jgi:Protein of unknown function (DUF4058)
MPSPFPGMDPYLERHWGDVHTRLITYSCDALQPRLPRDLRARVEERIVVTPPEGPVRDLVPDVRVVERQRLQRGGGLAVAEIADVAEPLFLTLDEDATERFIEIREAGSHERVVTVIEVLSPSNKRRGDDRDKYVKKRTQLSAAGVGLVEIDLLRGGVRELGDRSLWVPETRRTEYQACARRGWETIEFEVYRLPLRERLPKIRIPLRESDPDAILDLQAIVDQCYLNGGYDDIDYRKPAEPPLDDEDAAWADALLREKGLR